MIMEELPREGVYVSLMKVKYIFRTCGRCEVGVRRAGCLEVVEVSKEHSKVCGFTAPLSKVRQDSIKIKLTLTQSHKQ